MKHVRPPHLGWRLEFEVSLTLGASARRASLLEFPRQFPPEVDADQADDAAEQEGHAQAPAIAKIPADIAADEGAAHGAELVHANKLEITAGKAMRLDAPPGFSPQAPG